METFIEERLGEELVDDPAEPDQILEPVGLNVNIPQPQPTRSSPSTPTQAAIWSHFKKASKNEATCNICKKKMKTPTGVTSSLIRHLQSQHSIVYRQYQEEQKKQASEREAKQKLKLPTAPKQPKIDELFSKREKMGPSHPRAISITKAIGRWMAKSFHPYSLAEEEGFRNLMGIVEPRYVIPSRTTFSRSVIPELFLETKTRIKKEVSTYKKDIKSLSVTSDIWTSASNDSFISVTGHYIDSDFSIKSHCFGNSYFPEEHNAVNIASKITAMLNEWGLNQSATLPIYCITDNAANMVSAVALTPWTHLRCFAHTLQLALSDAKKEIPGMLHMLAKARAIVGHYKHSSAAQTRLNKIQEQLGTTPPLNLIQDCETRWNSEFNMLSRLVALKQAIFAELSTSVKPHNLTSTEWELAEGYIYILKPLDDATKVSSSSFLPTLSAVLPLLDGVKTVITKFIASGKKGVMFARALFKSLNLRFPSDQYLLNKRYLLAMMVDPRYKGLILDGVSKNLAIELLEREIILLHKEPEAGAAALSLPSTSGSGSGGSQGFEDADEGFSLWDHLQSLSQKTDSPLEEVVRNQVKAYLNLPIIPITENPCEWWKQNGLHYPMMIPVTKHYLGIPATEVPSERVFSSAGNVVNVRRRNLTQEHVSELVFLHHNL